MSRRAATAALARRVGNLQAPIDAGDEEVPAGAHAAAAMAGADAALAAQEEEAEEAVLAVERELQGNGDGVAGAHIHLQQPQLPGDLLAPGLFHGVGEGDE